MVHLVYIVLVCGDMTIILNKEAKGLNARSVSRCAMAKTLDFYGISDKMVFGQYYLNLNKNKDEEKQCNCSKHRARRDILMTFPNKMVCISMNKINGSCVEGNR